MDPPTEKNIFIKANSTPNMDNNMTNDFRVLDDKTISISSNLFTSSKKKAISETSIVDHRLMDIHNALLNSEFIPSMTEFTENLYNNQTGGYNITTDKFSTTSHNTSSIFPTTFSETLESLELPKHSSSIGQTYISHKSDKLSEKSSSQISDKLDNSDDGSDEAGMEIVELGLSDTPDSVSSSGKKKKYRLVSPSE